MQNILMILGAITLIVFLFIFVIMFIKYLRGDFDIQTIEEVERNTYMVNDYDWYGNKYNGGRATRIVNKITYQSGKIKYKTHEYRH